MLSILHEGQIWLWSPGFDALDETIYLGVLAIGVYQGKGAARKVLYTLEEVG